MYPNTKYSGTAKRYCLSAGATEATFNFPSGFFYQNAWTSYISGMNLQFTFCDGANGSNCTA